MAEVSRTEYVIDGLRCVVRTSGPQSEREAVVFVHGNPGSSEDWLDLLAHVGDIGRAIAPDMPAYGKSERPREFEYTVRGYARYLDGVLRTLGVERVHLVLHDFGGPWGLQWAIDHPQQVASFTFFNMGVMPGYAWHLVAKLWRTPVVGELLQAVSNRASFKAVLNAGNPKPFPETFLDRMYDDTDPVLKHAQLALYRATSSFDELSRAAEATFVPLALPVLAIWGEGDPFIPAKYAAVQKERLNAELHVLPNAGHWPMIDEPDLVRSWVVPFFQKHIGRGQLRAASSARP